MSRPRTGSRAQTGSAMSTKQLVRTVVDGKRVTFRFAPDDEITGYLCGMDDFHWMVIEPNGQKHLVHKGSAPRITLSDDSTYDDEPRLRALDKIIAPFREWVLVNHLGRGAAVSATSEGLSA